MANMVTLIEHSFDHMVAQSAQLSKWDVKNKKIILDSLEEGNDKDLQAFKEDFGQQLEDVNYQRWYGQQWEWKR